MKIKELSKEELAENSMVELAFMLMKEKNQPFEYYDLIEEIANLKGMANEQVKERISFLYTDLNIDGRFLTLGDNRWGLRAWYPLEQVEEEITSSVSTKPKKKAKVLMDDDLEDEFEEDEFEDLEDELDELSHEEESDDDDDEEEEVFKADEELDEFEEDEEEAIDEEEED